MTLAELFPDADYRFSLKVEKGTPSTYFAPTSANPEILDERQSWLTTTPAAYLVAAPESKPLLDEMRHLMTAWKIATPSAGSESQSAEPLASCLALGCALEPDFVLLARGADGIFLVIAGAVCFPSHWSLPEKAGLPLESIHGIVPGLNPAIGAGIARILEKLRPENPLFRSNWGLQNGCERNDHPGRKLPRLTAETSFDQIWIRAEHQSLISLPQTGGILFGIRIAHHPLAEITAHPALARGLLRALTTMPEPLAHYKGLAAIRPRLTIYLAGAI